jgi:hypothetical protein
LNEHGTLGSSDDDWLERGWWISIPGLSRQRAEAILKLVRESGLVEEAGLIDPSLALVLYTDRTTAEWLHVALSDEPANIHDLYSDSLVDVTPSAAREAMEAITADIEDFLENSAES